MAAPDHFDVDDDTGQVAVLDEHPSEKDREALLRAAAICPGQALSILD